MRGSEENVRCLDVTPITQFRESDELGRVEKISYPDGLYESFFYDGVGNLTNFIDTAGRQTAFTYAPTRYITSARRVLDGFPDQNVVVTAAYDQQFNVLSFTDPLGRNVETYELDVQDRPVTIRNVETQEMTVAWGVAGFVESVARFDGTEVSFDYDGEGLLSQVSFPSVTNTYAYYDNRLLKTAENEEGVVSNQYDAVSRLGMSVSVVPSGTVSYLYCPAGQVAKVTSVAGVISNAYDAAARVAQISSPEGEFSHTYNPSNGWLALMIGGVFAGYSYDVVDRLTGIIWRDASNSVLHSFEHGYDDGDMITNVAFANGRSVAYTYDSLYRLTGERQYDATNALLSSVAYQYDLAGNRTAAVVDGVTNAYTLGAGNRLASWGPNSWAAYDAAGNTTSLYYNASRKLDLQWNDRYQVSAVLTNGTVAETYGYDALGRRVWVSEGELTNYLVYDGVHVIAEVDAGGVLLKSYTWGPGIDNLLAFTDYTGGETNTYYALTDNLGTVHGLAGESGDVIESYRFDAWGRVLGVYDGNGALIDGSAVGNNYLWQGRWHCWDTGLYYFRARWYDPITGRWLSKDPIGIAGGLNQYEFCGNNPVNFRDPLGLDTGLGKYGDPRSVDSIGRVPAYDVRKYDRYVWYALVSDILNLDTGTGAIGSVATLSGFRGSVRLWTYRPPRASRITNYSVDIMGPIGPDPFTGEEQFGWTSVPSAEQAESILSSHPDLVQEAIEGSTPSRLDKVIDAIVDFAKEMRQ